MFFVGITKQKEKIIPLVVHEQNTMQNNVLVCVLLFIVHVVHPFAWKQVISQRGPSARFDFAFANSERHLFLFGGSKQGFQLSDELYTFDKTMQLWNQILPESSMWPTARKDTAAVFLNNSLILIAGSSTKGQFLCDVWKFSLANRQWANLTITSDAQLCRYGHAVTVASDRKHTQFGALFLYGGKLASGKLAGDLIISFDGTRWFKLPVQEGTEIPGARMWSSIVYAEEEQVIVIFGGFNGTSNCNDLWFYSIGSGSFEKVAAMDKITPAVRSGHQMFYSQRKVFVIGGEGEDGNGMNDVWEFGMESRKWRQLTSSSVFGKRLGYGLFGSSFEEGQLCLFGGIDGWSNKTLLNDLWVTTASNVSTLSN